MGEGDGFVRITIPSTGEGETGLSVGAYDGMGPGVGIAVGGG